MKKIIAAVLIGFSIMTCFAACGKKEAIKEITSQQIAYYVVNEIECTYNAENNSGHEVKYLYDNNGTKIGVIATDSKIRVTYDYSNPIVIYPESDGNVIKINPTITQESIWYTTTQEAK